MASDLVLIECDRVLIRAVKLGEIDESMAADRRAHLNAAAAHWHLCRLSLDIVDRARRPFRNLCVPLTRFTWHPRWQYVPPSRAWNSSVWTTAFAAPVGRSHSDCNPAAHQQRASG